MESKPVFKNREIEERLAKLVRQPFDADQYQAMLEHHLYFGIITGVILTFASIALALFLGGNL